MEKSTNAALCFRCRAPLNLLPGNVGRGENCSQCSASVRVCYNCTHYDERSYNQCREPMAERVVDKDKANFCDYFSLRTGGLEQEQSKKEESLRKLDALFK